MKRVPRIGVVLLLGTVPVMFRETPVGATPFLYVATNGNDAWSGTLPEPNANGADGPFATPHRAQEALRALGADAGLPEGACVYVREGVYCLDKPLAFEHADSGVAGAPVVWQPYGAEQVRLVAGIRLGQPTAHQGAVVQYDLSDGSFSGDVSQVFFNGERQVCARWPNKGADDMPGGAWAFVAGAVVEERTRSFHYAGDRPRGWSTSEGVQVSIWPNYNWWQTVAPVEKVNLDTRTVQLASELPYTIEPGRRFFFQNVAEELDAPGEWFFNPASKVLFFWPPGSLDGAEVVVAAVDHAVTFQDTAYVNLIGFSIEATHSDGIVLKDANSCLIARCTVRDTGGFGIQVSGGRDVRIEGNDIFHTGGGGVVLQGGDRKTLSPGGHQALNNHIHHFGELYQTYQTAVNIGGVGNRVAHNLIHDAPHIAILLGGNDHVIEFNDIHHVCMEGSDNGAFYMGRDWTQRGNVLRYNRFHDVYGFGLANLGSDQEGAFIYESPHQAWGVYLDDCSSGTTVFGNIFYRVPLCGVMIGGGRDNMVKNNIFVECIPALHIDDRWDSYCWDVMFERLNAMDYRKPPYCERYPELLDMGEDPRRPENNRFVRNIVMYASDDFRGLSSAAPKPGSAIVYDFDQFDPDSTVIDGNLLFHQNRPLRVAWSVYKEPGHSTLSWSDWQERSYCGTFENPPAACPEWDEWLLTDIETPRWGFDAHSIIADPRFLDPDNDDYSLRSDSPALTDLGFERIPAYKIGLYKSEFRASWPPPRDTRKEGVQHRTWPVRLAEAGQPSPG